MYNYGEKSREYPDSYFDIDSSINQQNYNHNNSRRRKKCDAYLLAQISKVSSIMTLLILLIAIILGLTYYGTNYTNIQKFGQFFEGLEKVNIKDIQSDIDIVTRSMDQFEELVQALDLIKDKQVFVKKMIYVIDYLCRTIEGCDSNINVTMT